MLEKPLDILKLEFANSILLYIFIIIVILCIPLQSITLNGSKFYVFGFFFLIILIVGFQLASNVYSNSNNIELHNKHYDYPDDKIDKCPVVCKSYKDYQIAICGILGLFILLILYILFKKNFDIKYINNVTLNICLLLIIIVIIFGMNIGFYFKNTTKYLPSGDTRDGHTHTE